MIGWQLVVKEITDGLSTAIMIERCASVVSASHVLVDEVDGGGNVRLSFVQPQSLLFDLGELLSLARKMDCFDWGDFYFLRQPEDAVPLRAVRKRALRIALCGLCLRCVDGSYFYVYGTDEQVRNHLTDLLQPQEYKDGGLAELDYPD